MQADLTDDLSAFIKNHPDPARGIGLQSGDPFQMFFDRNQVIGKHGAAYRVLVAHRQQFHLDIEFLSQQWREPDTAPGSSTHVFSLFM